MPTSVLAEVETRASAVRRSPVTLLIAAWAAVTLAARYAIDPLALQHDQALYLECARRILAGERPYVDFFDINPPLVMYVNVPIAWAAQVLRLNPIPAFTAAVTLLSAASAWLMLRWTRAIAGLTPVDRLVLLVLPLGPCALNPAESGFGQREHLFLLLYLPVFALRVARAEHRATTPSALAFLAGLAAGCGIGLKPHFLLPVLAVEAVVLSRTRSWRSVLAPELAGAAVALALYAVHFLLLPAAIREGFFGRVVPLVTSGYGAYNPPPMLVAAGVARRFALLIGALLLAAFIGPRRLTKPFLLPAVAFAAGALVMAAAQMKGWRYHYLPADAVVVFLSTAVLSGAARRATAVTIAAVVTGLLAWPIVNQRAVSRYYRMRDVIARYAAPGAPVAFLTTELDLPFPTVQQTAHPLVTSHLWSGMLVLALHARPHDAVLASNEERRFLDETIADLERRQPAAIFVEDHEGCVGCEPGFTMLTWSLRQPRLAAILSTYHFRGVERTAAIYTR